ncbi:MAG: hypothetical protein AAF296_11575 [Pseudomonadota bacterium]
MKPLALLLEDNEGVRIERAEQLRNKGLSVLTASSVDEAREHLYSSPSLDLLICDINLDEANPNDKSGYEFAEEARSRFHRVEIVGYSGQFEAKNFKRTEKAQSIFTEMFARGKQREFNSYIADKVEELSQKFDLSSLDNEFKELVGIIRRNLLSDQAIGSSLHEFISQLQSITTDLSELAGDFDLAQSGYKIVVFPAQDVVALDRSGQNIKLVRSIPVWCRYENGMWRMEVFGHHSFEATCANRSDGFREILASMYSAKTEAADFDQQHMMFADQSIEVQ